MIAKIMATLTHHGYLRLEIYYDDERTNIVYSLNSHDGYKQFRYDLYSMYKFCFNGESL